MSRGILVSQKHGVNPTIPICLYCGEAKNEIALLGRLPGDAEAPKYSVINIEPCDACKEKYADYTMLVEMREQYRTTAYSRTPLGPKLTGRWLAIRKECLNVEMPTPIAYVTTGDFNQILRDAQKAQEGDEGENEC